MSLANWTTVQVTGTYLSPTGVPVQGSLSFQPQCDRLLNASQNTMILGFATEVQIDGAGKIKVTLPATDDTDIAPLNFTYHVTEHFPSGREFDISLPSAYAGTGIDMSALTLVLPNIGIPLATLSRAEFDELAATVTSSQTQLQLGGWYLWVDATGKLRIKHTAPTFDTDGVVVGTQT